MGIGNPLHIAILLLIVLMVFGARRLPELGRSLGGGIKEFRGSLENGHKADAPEQLTPAPAAEVAVLPVSHQPQPEPKPAA